MNQKGFTLAELLAIIVILSLLTLLVGTSIVPLVKGSKKDLNDVQIKAIESATEAWCAENLDRIPENKQCVYIKLQDLKESGLLDAEVKNIELEENINNEIKIKISFALHKAISFEVNSNDISDCEYVGIFEDNI